MVSVNITALRGANYDFPSSYTIGVASTGSGDMQVRYQLLDQNGVQITKKDLIQFLKHVIYGLESGKDFFGKAVSGNNFTGPQI